MLSPLICSSVPEICLEKIIQMKGGQVCLQRHCRGCANSENARPSAGAASGRGAARGGHPRGHRARGQEELQRETRGACSLPDPHLGWDVPRLGSTPASLWGTVSAATTAWTPRSPWTHLAQMASRVCPPCEGAAGTPTHRQPSDLRWPRSPVLQGRVQTWLSGQRSVPATCCVCTDGGLW